MLLFISFPIVIYAEVADKVISKEEILRDMVIYSFIALAINIVFPKIFLITSIVTIFLSSTGLFTLTDNLVGHAVIEEIGKNYMLVSVISVLMVILSNIAGVIIRRRLIDKIIKKNIKVP